MTEQVEERELEHSEVADEILAHGDYVTLEETDEILEYRGGVYVKGAESRIRKEIELKRAGRCTNQFCNEVLGHIKRHTYRSLTEFDSDLFVLNLKNGLLDLRDMSFTNHRPEYLSLSQLEVSYNRRAKAKAFSSFVHLVLPDFSSRQRSIDFFASCLFRRAIKRAFMAVGDADSGKSTYLKLIHRFLGAKNVSNIPLQDFEKDRFISANTVGKLSNIYFDLSDESLRATGKFKTRTSGDPMNVQRKNGHPFDFVPYFKELYSANKIPDSKDESSAFYGRWVIVPFSRQFTEEAREVDEDGIKVKLPPKDRFLLDRLTTEEELSGILNILIKRLKLILELGDIPNAPTEEESRLVWQSSSDFERMFFNETVTTENRSGEIGRAELYKLYVEWAHKKKITPKTDRAFNDKVKRLLGALTLDTTRDREKVKLWKGICFKDPSNIENQLKNAVVSVVSVKSRKTTGTPTFSNSSLKLTEYPFWLLEPQTCKGCGKTFPDGAALESHKKIVDDHSSTKFRN
jgi:putative DNA primase/helicase